jgi:hypothetical protein
MVRRSKYDDDSPAITARRLLHAHQGAFAAGSVAATRTGRGGGLPK